MTKYPTTGSIVLLFSQPIREDLVLPRFLEYFWNIVSRVSPHPVPWDSGNEVGPRMGLLYFLLMRRGAQV